MRKLNNRKFLIFIIIVQFVFLASITVAGQLLTEQALVTDFSRKDLQPSFQYLFGTDWLGRDMFVRTITGLSTSIHIGLLTASVSAVIAFILGTASATMGKAIDSFISLVIDMVMGMPHILLLILISFAVGRGFNGVVIAVSLTHWVSLARVVRAEVLQLKESQYIKISEKLGISKFKIVLTHMIPHLLPQFIVGLILLFPHAILHESSITFLAGPYPLFFTMTPILNV